MQTHPGKGVTTFIPDNVATQPRKSASGSPRTLTTQEHGSTGGLRLALGNRRLMLEQAVSIGVDAQAFMSLHEGQARTCVLVGINGNVVAALAIADPLKPEARTVVAALQAQVGGLGARDGTSCRRGFVYWVFESLRGSPLRAAAEGDSRRRCLLQEAKACLGSALQLRLHGKLCILGF